MNKKLLLIACFNLIQLQCMDDKSNKPEAERLESLLDSALEELRKIHHDAANGSIPAIMALHRFTSEKSYQFWGRSSPLTLEHPSIEAPGTISDSAQKKPAVLGGIMPTSTSGSTTTMINWAEVPPLKDLPTSSKK